MVKTKTNNTRAVKKSSVLNDLCNKINSTQIKYNGTAIIYTRVSTKNQTNGTSMMSQFDECQKYCFEHNYKILEHIMETTSAKDINNQTKLIDMINRNSNCHLIMYEPSRLSRDYSGFGLILKLCQSKSIIVHSVQSNISTCDTSGLKSIINGVIDGQHEIETLSARVKQSILFRKRNKTYTSSIPKYGFQYKKKKNLNLTVRSCVKNCEEQSIITLINSLYYGDSVSNINQMLNDITKSNNHALYSVKDNDSSFKNVEYGNMTLGNIAELLNSCEIYKRGKQWTSIMVASLVK